MNLNECAIVCLGKRKLMLTVVKPHLNNLNKRQESDVSINDVLLERLTFEHMEENSQVLAEKVAKAFRQSKNTELPRCRLKASLYSQMGVKVAEGISGDDILDSGNKVIVFYLLSYQSVKPLL